MLEALRVLVAAGFFLSATSAISTTVEVCATQPKAKFNLVYLHGLDDPKPSRQELNNRELLQRLSKKLELNLIVARSSVRCASNKLCWPHQNQDSLMSSAIEIAKLSEKCAPQVKRSVWLGFSNGGYFVSKLAMLCSQNLDAVIAAGSAGQVRLGKQQNAADCPKVYQIIGESDLTYGKARKFHDELVAQKFPAEFHSFRGRHELNESGLVTILKKVAASITD